MAYNLLEQQWIPVVRSDNQRVWIRPSEITSDYINNPILRLDFDRADFNGSILQFLIGLLQTCSAPEQSDDCLEERTVWRDRFFTPPSPEILGAEFNVYKHAFNLDGEYPRFMQDETVQDQDSSEWEIYKILIDGFGASDHFGKFEKITSLGYRSLAAALICHQINTTNSAGGQDGQYRSSLRNAGFLTTILVSKEGESPSKRQNINQRGTLWETLWLNVLPTNTFNRTTGNPKKNTLESIFPWMGPTRISSSEDKKITPEDSHPLTIYWATPRRIHLDFNIAQKGICSLCGDNEELVLSSFKVKIFGNNYKLWQHHLTPGVYDENGIPSGFYETKKSGTRYSDWLGIITNIENEKLKTKISKTIEYYRYGEDNQDEEDLRSIIAPNTKVAAFGFVNDKAKILTYQFGELPIITVKKEYLYHMDRIASQYIESADFAAKSLGEATKACDNIKAFAFVFVKKKNKWEWKWESKKQKLKKESGLVISTESLFWERTENDFYKIIKKTAKELQENNEPASIAISQIKEEWRRIIAKKALDIFHETASACPPQQSDIRSIVRAELELQWAVNGSKKNSEIHSILGINKAEQIGA